MRYQLSYKTKQFFFVLIKLSIVVGAFYFIYYRLANNNTLVFSEFIEFSIKNNVFSLKNILFLLFLSISNWFFEILKWRTLVSAIKKITFKNALEQSLGALTASLFTPNRIGEYGAKAIYYASPLRKRILLINLISNMLQMAVTTFFGVIGLCFLISNYDININYYKLSIVVIIGLTGATLIVFGFGKSRYTIKGFSFQKIKDFILKFSRRKITLAFIYSLIRYLIFSFQFYFLLSIFKVDIDYFNAMYFITSMYLLASIIPSIFIFDVIIRGSVAVYLFSFMGVNELVILSITTIMWLLNFVLPGIFGSYYVLNFNLPKNDN
ncbi:MAG: lysylphosphatidylglycerol synthase domain-containing protein [Flavobacteriaceae bacterium]